MEDKTEVLKREVSKIASSKNFVHHKWFVKYHLNFVEQISLELCDIYPDADKSLVKALVWIHDYGKILNLNEMDKISNKIEVLLSGIGFDREFIQKVVEYLVIFERKMEVDLNSAPIEVKIVSSADAASHMIGPFYSIWLYENPEKSIEELIEGNKNKLLKDWNRKIVLPEVKKAFEERFRFVLENSGEFPKKFFILSH